jgi:hypothetical protein
MTGPDFYVKKQELLGGMNLYFGNLHSHTEYSDGKGTPAEAFAWARDQVGLNFYAVTDHAEQLNDEEWKDIVEQAKRSTMPGRFIGMSGFEWSNPLYGHITVWGTESYVSAVNRVSLSSFYNWLDSKQGFAQFNHPGEQRLNFNNLQFDPSVEKQMAAIETGNKGDGNVGGKFYPHYISALDRGWKVAPTNNFDNHDLKAKPHRTVVISPVLYEEALLQSIGSRRVYSTDDSNMQVIFKYGTTWMGSKVGFAFYQQQVAFDILVDDDEPILKIELVTNGGKVVAQTEPETNQVYWKPEIQHEGGNTYYFVKVYERDIRNEEGHHSGTQVAITAPIWFA